MTKGTLTQEDLKRLLDYDPATGGFAWKVARSNRVKVGQEAGVVAANGRRYISLNGRAHMAHHLAWLYVHGEWSTANLAPVNGDYLDIRIENLRPETAAETARKGSRHKALGASGLRGVSFDKSRGKWIATITRDYHQTTLGRFDTKEEAEAAYLSAGGAPKSDSTGKEARASAARSRYVRHALWRRTLDNAGGITGWKSFEAFIADVGDAPNERHVLAVVDPAKPIGPANFAWMAKEGFDHSTSEGRAAYSKAHREANPMLYRGKGLAKTFGIDLAEYQRLFVEQGGVCACCGKPETEARAGKTRWLAVDHDHATGDVRGLLCMNCNKGLGLLRDSVAVLTQAIAYLKRHSKSAGDAPENVVTLVKKELA